MGWSGEQMRGRAGRVRLCPQGFASMAGTAGTAGSVQRQSVLRWVPRPGAPHFPRCTPCLACPPPPSRCVARTSATLRRLRRGCWRCSEPCSNCSHWRHRGRPTGGCCRQGRHHFDQNAACCASPWRSHCNAMCSGACFGDEGGQGSARAKLSDCAMRTVWEFSSLR